MKSRDGGSRHSASGFHHRRVILFGCTRKLILVCNNNKCIIYIAITDLYVSSLANKGKPRPRHRVRFLVLAEDCRPGILDNYYTSL